MCNSGNKPLKKLETEIEIEIINNIKANNIKVTKYKIITKNSYILKLDRQEYKLPTTTFKKEIRINNNISAKVERR